MSEIFGAALMGGGSGPAFAAISVTYPAGATCICSLDGKTLTAPDTSGTALFIVPYAGEWIVTAVQGNDTATAILNIIEPKAYVVVLDFLVPFDYQRIEYIQSDGNQYIKTGYQLENASKVAKTSFAFDAAFINATNQAAVYNIMGSGNYFMGWDKSSANKIVFAVGTGDTKTYSFTRDNGRHVWAADPSTGIIKFDDEILYSGNFNGSLGGYPELWLCIGSLNITTPSRLYGAEIKYDGEIVHQYYPCYRKNDNVVGVWDFVEKEFLTNAGSGLFIAGGDIQ